MGLNMWPFPKGEGNPTPNKRVLGKSPNLKLPEELWVSCQLVIKIYCARLCPAPMWMFKGMESARNFLFVPMLHNKIAFVEHTREQGLLLASGSSYPNDVHNHLPCTEQVIREVHSTLYGDVALRKAFGRRRICMRHNGT